MHKLNFTVHLGLLTSGPFIRHLKVFCAQNGIEVSYVKGPGFLSADYVFALRSQHDLAAAKQAIELYVRQFQHA